MDLKSKLGLYKESHTGKNPGKTGREKDIDALTDGIAYKNDDGSFFLLEKKFPLSYIYGGCSLGDALLASPSSLQKLGNTNGKPLTAEDLLFLDTETTGLSGGTGTVAFLIGTGFFEDDYFIVRQYFMRDYDEEPAVLSALNESLSKFKGLVTFNGRAFDWNLLSSRFTFNRIKPVCREPINIDLLFPARKIWGLKLESCRLASLEENILSEFRVDDIPGAMIPTVYFKYLEDRDATDIIKVIQHNEYDILAMAALLRKMSLMLEEPFSEENGDYELLGLGRIFEACGELESSINCFESCSRSKSYAVRSTSVKRLTQHYKRNGELEKALRHWQHSAGTEGGLSLFSMIELAKYYEHNTRDIKKALAIVEKALDLCRKTGLYSSSRTAELCKRYERLKRKAERLI